MRYSRFRSQMLGLEPTRRNRTSAPKSRVTKSKKDSKGKANESFKSESTTSTPSTQELPETEPSHHVQPQRIKQERPHYEFDNRLTPGVTPSPMPPPPTVMGHPNTIQPRLLTPCSDGDGYTPSPIMAPSPDSEMFESQPSLMYDGLSLGPYRHTFTNAAWPHGPAPSYPGYDNPYQYQDQTVNPYNILHHHHMPQHHHQHHTHSPAPTIEREEELPRVKNEEYE